MLCPACNALIDASPLCRTCGAPAVDEGRLADRLGPYSPYEATGLSIPDGAMSGTASPLVCLHAARCPDCGASFSAAIPLWPS